MPRKKKTKEDERKKTVVHTKRKEVLDDEGWTHIIDAPNRKKAEGLKATPLLHGGDFVRDGVSYITRSMEELKQEFEHWKKQWDENFACSELETLIDGSKKDKIENVVFLGMGSLQNARREGRRASATQLAALQTIISIFGREEKELEVVLQDPQFTDLDKEFLGSFGYKVVQDPEGFKEVKEGTLVYAIHCYVDVYKAISEGPRPAVLIGTDVGNFGRFESRVLPIRRDGTTNRNRFEKSGVAKALDEMVQGYDVLDFPQIRHDFSDTKIYWRKAPSTIEPAEP